LKSAELALTDDKLWEVLEFWGLLGDVMVHGDVLVLDLGDFIKLMQPILHHAPTESLRRMKSLRDNVDKIPFDEIVVPDFQSLGSDVQNKIEKWILRLEADRILQFDVLSYMSCWKDLGDSQRRSIIQVLEGCFLLVGRKSEGINGADTPDLHNSWLVPCRLTRAALSSFQDPTSLLQTGGPKSLLFRAKTRFLPSGFFSSLVASQIVCNEDHHLKLLLEHADSLNLEMKVKTILGRGPAKGWEIVTLRQVSIKEPGGDETAIELWSTSLAIIKRISSEMDRMIQKKFPGIVFTYLVFFKDTENSDEQDGVLEWSVDSERGSLASILEQRRLDLLIDVKTMDKRLIQGMTSGDALCAMLRSSAFFLSHAWGDWSVKEAAWVKVTEGVQRMVEEQSGELVWVDSKEMSNVEHFHEAMRRGIAGSSCVIICISRLYLTRPNCLREIAWAVQVCFKIKPPLMHK
jgi:hypothetical protein